MNTQEITTNSIVHEFQIAADLDAVYAAVKTQQGVAGWWNTRCEVSEEVGGRSQMSFNKEGHEVVMVFRNDELKENERVAWTCVENANPYWVGSKISFDMRATDAGTEFRFVHDQFNSAAHSDEIHAMIAGGWQHFMNSFKTYCETGEGQPWG